MVPPPASVSQITPVDHNAGQQWLLQLPAQHYIPLPLRVLGRGQHPGGFTDSYTGNSLLHGALVQLSSGQSYYEYLVTFGPLAGPKDTRRLHIPIESLYADPATITLAQIEKALRLLVMAGSAAEGPKITLGVMVSEQGRWKIVFVASDGRMAGSWPLGETERASGEDAVFDGLRREVEPSL